MYSKKDYHVLSSFYLKIIGMITMIIDHIGVFYEMNHDYFPSYSIDVTTTLRIIGRISFIIFAFLVVEGVQHSRKPWLYLLQLLGLSIIMDLGYLIIHGQYIGNPITTLFLGGVAIYALEQKKWYIKLLSLFPIGITLLIAFNLIPLLADYDIYGMCTILIFYFGQKLALIVIKGVTNQYGLDYDSFKEGTYGLTLKNAVPVILFITFALVIYFVDPIWNETGFFTDINTIQVYAIFGTIPLLFYSGKRGYNKPWFKWGCYAFFPLHIIIIFLVFKLITM